MSHSLIVLDILNYKSIVFILSINNTPYIDVILECSPFMYHGEYYVQGFIYILYIARVCLHKNHYIAQTIVLLQYYYYYVLVILIKTVVMCFTHACY